MEDVIFAGTRDKKALGMAAVTMTLVPDESKLNLLDRAKHEKPQAAAVPAEVVISEAPLPAPEAETAQPLAATLNANYSPNGHGDSKAEILRATERTGEITITRRLYRSGESEYLINGKTSRLRDIQDLFLGTGLGPESYAIIEQGRIGQILSNKPQDRRAVIEEAAGITKFKTRKRLAEAKLESAKQNLVARVRHFGRSHQAGQFAEAASGQDQTVWRAARGIGCALTAVAGGKIPSVGTRDGQGCH